MSNTTTHDHATIQKWAKKHGGVPGTIEEATTAVHSQPLAIIFPENKGDNKFQEISWPNFFDNFELRQLALSYDSNTSSKVYEFVTRG